MSPDAEFMSALQSIQRLTQSSSFQKLALIVPEETGFNLIEMLQTTVSENSWSRVLAFLLDCRREHGLGNMTLARWSALVEFGTELKHLVCQYPKNQAIAETEWVTSEGRRLDILVRLSDELGRLRGIIGIENKVKAGESDDQVGNYQRELANEFQRVPKLLIFLTPTGRLPITADDTEKRCPAIPVSYETLVQVFHQLSRANSVNTDLARLLQSLCEYIRKEIIKPMEETTKIKNLVRKLYASASNRKAMNLIVEHLPSVGDLCEDIEAIVDTECEKKYPRAKGYWMYYPKRAKNTVELKWLPEELDEITWEHGNHFGINFMLRSHSPVPQIGDDFIFYLAAWCESEADNAKARKLLLPNWCASSPKRLDSQWEELWIGKSYKLRDLGDRDTEGLAKLMLDGISATYTKVRRKVLAQFPVKK
ncbi:MAG: PD-(D/E)XK nuclease family protein [Terrimicrobiaceae bacterium]